ncbi:MAG: FAD-dependent oxidoreductase [Candidatus Schekmanbacteria bacterium RBG_13_48_7]|uniref:FAD-dependent oxidoreductase n=1 Tax=Candidatus Schekmanbacteria bacterium RBG_13_48_7 TaxID=1817878 RepID=A0A1F7RS52_9BACT|nr:MAG: FAD-dependent oxidoreductase [Candidatus Schekmanbacteria bacterium RBG_13_48_7]
MKNKAAVVIIGGGVIGCATAYNLAKQGLSDAVIVEKNFLTSGATGRCGAGVRQQWGLEMNCRLAKASVDQFEHLSEELDYNIEFRQGGYLIIAETDAKLDFYRKNVALQNSLGIPSRVITIEEAKQICPYLNPDGLVGATYCPTDGHCNPFATTFAYARAAKRMGVEINTHTEVIGIEVSGDRVTAVNTDKGKIHCEAVVNAAGGYSQIIGKMVGLNLPTYSERHEILVTEPVGHMFDTMVISFTTGLYVQQVPHGSIIMGMGDKTEPPSYNLESSWHFLDMIVPVVTKTLPVLKNVRIVRQWGGLYNKTPDCQPIIGEAETVKGFYNAVGFSGHGFMIAPITAEVIAKMIVKKPVDMPIEKLTLSRFAKGDLILEPSVVG